MHLIKGIRSHWINLMMSCAIAMAKNIFEYLYLEKENIALLYTSIRKDNLKNFQQLLSKDHDYINGKFYFEEIKGLSETISVPITPLILAFKFKSLKILKFILVNKQGISHSIMHDLVELIVYGIADERIISGCLSVFDSLPKEILNNILEVKNQSK